MTTDFNGTIMCDRLPREIRDKIYEYAWQLPDCSRWRGEYKSYLGLMSDPLADRGYLPGVLHEPVRETNTQVAAELVQWLYENADLGCSCFGESGMYHVQTIMPSMVCGLGCEAVEGPKLSIRDVEEVLNTDVFGVGVNPVNCKLRALTFRADYQSEDTNPDDRYRPDPIPELEAVTKKLLAQPKTNNFKLRIMTLAWRDDKYPDVRIVIELQNIFSRSCAKLTQNGVKVMPTYVEYDLHRESWVQGNRLRERHEYSMTTAIGAETLPVDEKWYHWGGDSDPRLITWEDAFSPISHTRTEDPLFL